MNTNLIVQVLNKETDTWATTNGRSQYTNLKWATKRALVLSKRRQDFARVIQGGVVVFEVFQPRLFAA